MWWWRWWWLVEIAKLRHTSITCQSKGWRIWPAIEWAWIKQVMMMVMALGILLVLMMMMLSMLMNPFEMVISPAIKPALKIIFMIKSQIHNCHYHHQQVSLKHNAEPDNSCSPPLCKDPVGFPSPPILDFPPLHQVGRYPRLKSSMSLLVAQTCRHTKACTDNTTHI